jgi:hypothetical protein
MEFLKSKFKECQESHQLCRQRFDLKKRWYPSRLLEIGSNDTIYLRRRDELEFATEPYFTLSHRWGSLTPTQLRSETEASLRTGTTLNNLPKTFRDAITVTRQFSVPYIWIDSMCIFQDDVQEWSREAAAMCDIYSRALCNIAATEAIDGSSGLFFERDPTAECPFWVDANMKLDRIGSEKISSVIGMFELFPIDHYVWFLEDGPLNKRAWVMQERFLSTRVMHFSAYKVFWECLENISSEIFPDAIPQQARPQWFQDSQWLKRMFFQSPRTDGWETDGLGTDLFDSWQVFAKAYSSCDLSEESDKLVAINGIRQILSKSTGNQLVCGLWLGRLVQELCWARYTSVYRPMVRSGAASPQKWRAPTWSWASTNVEIHPSNMRLHHRCPNLQYRVTIEGISAQTVESGQLKHASLTLRGKLLLASFVQEKQAEIYSSTEFICGSSAIAGRLFSDVSFRYIPDEPETHFGRHEGLVCLSMFSCRCASKTARSRDEKPAPPTELRFLEALALRPHGAEKDTYERVVISTSRTKRTMNKAL